MTIHIKDFGDWCSLQAERCTKKVLFFFSFFWRVYHVLTIIPFSSALQHFCLKSSKKDNASEGGEDTAGSEKADAAGSSDEDEGALVIDEKNDRGGGKRKAVESREVGFHPYGQFNIGGRKWRCWAFPLVLIHTSFQLFVRSLPSAWRIQRQRVTLQ